MGTIKDMRIPEVVKKAIAEDTEEALFEPGPEAVLAYLLDTISTSTSTTCC